MSFLDNETFVTKKRIATMNERKDDLVPDDENSSAQPSWFRSIKSQTSDPQLFPHCKLGDGFAQYAIGSDTGCILIWQIDPETDVDEAAFDLEKAKECLANDEPCTEQVMAFVLHPERQFDSALYESRNIRCLTEQQLVEYAVDFFSEAKEQIRLGKAAYYQGNYEIAFSLLTSSNVDQDADAQFMIGQMYAKGQGVAKDVKAADEWYWKAVRLGHAGAAIEAEKSLNRAKKDLERMEQEIIDDIEEFTNELLEEDD